MGATGSVTVPSVKAADTSHMQCKDWLAVRVKLEALRDGFQREPAQRHEHAFVFRGQRFQLEYVPDTDTGVLSRIKDDMGRLERAAGRLTCRVSSAPSSASLLERIRQTVANLFSPLLDMWDADKFLHFGCPMLASRKGTMLRYLTPHVRRENLRSVNIDVDRIFAA